MKMTNAEQRCAAARFAEEWKDIKGEKQHTQSFWLALLRDVFGMEKPEQHIEFEVPVGMENGHSKRRWRSL